MLELRPSPLGSPPWLLSTVYDSCTMLRGKRSSLMTHCDPAVMYCSRDTAWLQHKLANFCSRVSDQTGIVALWCGAGARVEGFVGMWRMTKQMTCSWDMRAGERKLGVPHWTAVTATVRRHTTQTLNKFLCRLSILNPLLLRALNSDNHSDNHSLPQPHRLHSTHCPPTNALSASHTTLHYFHPITRQPWSSYKVCILDLLFF